MHLTSWPVDTFNGLEAILSRLFSLCPSRATQTHLLHLASYGDIYPHTDNIDASGSWILGVSLGDERLLKMEKNGESFSVELPSGSVYLQRYVLNACFWIKTICGFEEILRGTSTNIPF